MSRRKKNKGIQPATLLEAAREFLTPQVFRQAHQTKRYRQERRWNPSNLIYVSLLIAWCSGDSLPERFEIAKSFYVVSFSSRKRPGKSCAGFQKALSALPMPVLRAVASGLRQQIMKIFSDRWMIHGFVPLGGDGSSHECSRIEELEQRLGSNGKSNASPTLWNTTIVHLGLGIPWCWRWGRGAKASEREHVLQMIRLLPKFALLVLDAGFVSFELMQQLANAGICYLIRMSSKATFYTESMEPLEDFVEGSVYYWTKERQKQGLPPIQGRLIRIRNDHRKDVWLFTNVEKDRLPLKIAAMFYRWRWKNEGFFRTYKGTMKKVKIDSHSVRLVHREAETSMIALQLLLCIGMRQMPTACTTEEAPVLCSPRKVLLEIRRSIKAPSHEKKSFWRRIAQATCEQHTRITPKEKREWPRRKQHVPPKPPKLLRITNEQKALLTQHFNAV